LGDLNVSKVAKKGLGYTQTGTPYYASPEVWRDQPYDIKSDIWSLGCVLYEMITLKPPFRAPDMQSLYKKVLKGVYPRIPTSYSQDLATIVKHLLQVSSHLRPTCTQILKLPMIQKKIERLFPEQNLSESEENILLQTIRVPKNLLYLTDRLPKPNYASEADNSLNRHTTTGDYLPDIKNIYKGSPYKVYVGNNRAKYKKLLSKDPNLGEVNIKKVNAAVKRNKLKTLERSKNEENEHPSISHPVKKDQENAEYEPDFNEESSQPNLNKVKPEEKDTPSKEPKKPVYEYKSGKKKKDNSLAVEGEQDHDSKVNLKEMPSLKEEIVRPVRHKYLRRKEKLNTESVPPVASGLLKESPVLGVPPVSNNNNEQGYNSPYIPDTYIRQIVGKRNPLIKPISHNLQMLANIYSGNPQQLSLIAKRLQSIKLPKVIFKRDEYSLSPYLQRGVKGIMRPKLLDEFEKNPKQKDVSPLRPKLEPIKPIKLLNYAKDLQAIGIKAHGAQLSPLIKP